MSHAAFTRRYVSLDSGGDGDGATPLAVSTAVDVGGGSGSAALRVHPLDGAPAAGGGVLIGGLLATFGGSAGRASPVSTSAAGGGEHDAEEGMGLLRAAAAEHGGAHSHVHHPPGSGAHAPPHDGLEHGAGGRSGGGSGYTSATPAPSPRPPLHRHGSDDDMQGEGASRGGWLGRFGLRRGGWLSVAAASIPSATSAATALGVPPQLYARKPLSALLAEMHDESEHRCVPCLSHIQRRCAFVRAVSNA